MKDTQISQLGRIADALEALIALQTNAKDPSPEPNIVAETAKAVARANDAVKPAEGKAPSDADYLLVRDNIANLVREAYNSAKNDSQRAELKRAYAGVREATGYMRLAEVPDEELNGFREMVETEFAKVA